MTTWKKPKLYTQDKWKQQPAKTNRIQWGGTKQGKVPHHMDKPGWENKQANRLYND